MLKSSSEHLADIAAGSPPAASSNDGEEHVTAAGHANNDPEPLDPAYIESLQLLAEKKVREAEEKAKRDEEAEWFAAAEESVKGNNNNNAADYQAESGGNNNNHRTPTTEDILQSIEESVDYNNQTSGFVSSFALPLTPIAPDHDESDHEQVDNYDDSDDESHDMNESLSTHPHGTGDNDYKKKIITRQQGASSPASIFRTASSSSSTMMSGSADAETSLQSSKEDFHQLLLQSSPSIGD